MKNHLHPVEGRKPRVEGAGRALRSPLAARRSTARSGVALVITLILLSVTLVMAVAFLAISRRDRTAVAAVSDTAAARLAAESALAHAQAQIVAGIMVTNNPYVFGLFVSTNYINYDGYIPNKGGFTNVNYDYTSDNSAYSLNDFLSTVTNLLILPRAPVFVTNPVAGTNEFRFYVDLNRNGKFDTNGLVGNFDGFNQLIQDANGNTMISEVGDPEWIGVLQRPDQPHGPNNPFIARYAFFAAPADGALDVNYLHNQALTRQVNPASGGSDGYFRNQGVGSWEINFAAFLADLNTNEWLPFAPSDLGAVNFYKYNQPFGSINRGVAFDDARAFLSYRYNFNYRSLASADALYPNAQYFFPYDNVDMYSDGPLQTNIANLNEFFSAPPTDGDRNPNFAWVGADNPLRFFTPQEFFNPSETSGGANSFTNRLLAAGTNIATYDRYTFYRMLTQLGTDSRPEQGKMNLNWDNLDPYYTVVGGNNVTNAPATTNYLAWTPLAFFTNAADRMLRTYTTNWFRSNPSNYLASYYGFIGNYYYVDFYGNTNWNHPSGFGLTNYLVGTNTIPAFGVMNIPVYVNGRFVYTPAVNRVLQLAANMYDATTTNFYPSVFRPIFWVTNDNQIGVRNIYIKGYTVLGPIPPSSIFGQMPSQTDPLSQPVDVTTLLTSFVPSDGTNSYNVYGVPWIIGAKKHLVGFNQFSMVNQAQVTRKLQVARKSVGGPIWTNQLYVMNVESDLSASFWNSYYNNYPTNYPGPLRLSVYLYQASRMILTNSDWGSPSPASYTYAKSFLWNPTVWPGSYWGNDGAGDPHTNSFITVNWTNNLVPNEIYNFSSQQFNFITNGLQLWDTNRTSIDPLPQFGVTTTNWVQAIIVDYTNVIDYVQLRGPIDSANLNYELDDPDYESQTASGLLQWSTNLNAGSIPYGVVNQVGASKSGQNLPSGGQWKKPPNFPSSVPDTGNIAEAAFFGGILNPASTFSVNGISYTNYELAVQAPYTPSRTVVGAYLYQVNDPLVHYTTGDLDAGAGAVWQNTSVANGAWYRTDDPTKVPTPPTTAIIKGRYQPWGKAAPIALQALNYNFLNAYNLTYKDPLVWSADYWDFPTNQYPTVGWLGRVHRGTPWQTVYLKAHNVLKAPVGANIFVGTNTWAAWVGDNSAFDAGNSGPLQDRILFDLFTTAPNDNASHGKLSVNQTHQAAWSALFSGMVALTNNFGLVSQLVGPTYTNLIIDPVGVAGTNSPLWQLVNHTVTGALGIDELRAVFTNADGLIGAFEHAGDILSVPALTESSPFLNVSTTPAVHNQTEFGVRDEVYEWLPQQMMSLVDCPTEPRYVIYAYGQALKPAANSLVTSRGFFFGLCTNYQVVAESAVRAVVQVHPQVTNSIYGPVTNYTTTVESYNLLPPD